MFICSESTSKSCVGLQRFRAFSNFSRKKAEATGDDTSRLVVGMEPMCVGSSRRELHSDFRVGKLHSCVEVSAFRFAASWRI
jgi:hypothetical protein